MGEGRVIRNKSGTARTLIRLLNLRAPVGRRAPSQKRARLRRGTQEEG
jgi:hypothetical protein